MDIHKLGKRYVSFSICQKSTEGIGKISDVASSTEEYIDVGELINFDSTQGDRLDT